MFGIQIMWGVVKTDLKFTAADIKKFNIADFTNAPGDMITAEHPIVFRRLLRIGDFGIYGRMVRF